ncbi:23S rRNA (uracil(1939)-C(5))-methyltransferase RlmD [Amnimonas aquatica]|uniref:23S rRNA (uracil(1939)-C(5))-methyltransferase RlmD n=1 Tax=Amnimonas aquatica TaxID=2094561 RepID=A0A2P6ASV7_9GAMM|nr:23S rRNA (uracil(1939)-C(5))-methyltransferase RlmD [Amnimonas aquatica]PQA44062.1 23S rRNA (uracil(1939)-C(5))-methyltransferase RlmD [Amnimonas aquatica]
MSRIRKKERLRAQPPVELVIDRLSHEGRGIAHHADGKLVFVDGALPGERVSARVTFSNRKFDEAAVLDVFEAAADRVAPPCAHFGVCGGCSLQHMAPAAQIAFKQQVLADQLRHFGGLQPGTWLPPLTHGHASYRRKARLGVRYVIKKETLMVGFRERQGSYLADIHACTVMDQRLGQSITPLRQLIAGLVARDHIAQIEVAAGDELAGYQDVALVFRHLVPLEPQDVQALTGFCADRGWQCYLQPGGYDTVHRVWPKEGRDRLYYRLPDFDAPGRPGEGLTMAFHPNDFTQVNAGINQRMVKLALDLLDPQPTDRVLDLFCGLGNFTLPLATRAREVVGVEGVATMVERGYENARANGLTNVSFYAQDLTRDFSTQPWAGLGFDRILIDPARSGALEVIPHLARFGAHRVVYVSCNPATLARDAGEMAKAGYDLLQAGVMDMFTHTTHVESIAVFEKRRPAG